MINILWNVKNEWTLGITYGHGCLWIGFGWLIIEIELINT